jgi:hypothetical protein
MKFTLDAGGAQAAGQGIGSLFKAYALGPQMRQQAELESMGNTAKIGQAHATARYANARAGLDENQLRAQQDPMQASLLQLGLPTNLAPAFKNKLATGNFGGGYDTPAVDGVGPTMPAPADDQTMANLGRAMSLLQRITATGSNVSQGAEAGLKEQQMRQIEQVASNPAFAGAIGTAQAAGHGKPLFNPTGNTGQSVQNFTGASGPTNDVLAKLFGTSEGALVTQRNASAGASRAAAGLSGARQLRTEGGYDKTHDIVDEDTGAATVTRFPTGGEPISIGVAPSKGTGEAATNAKARNAVIAAVEKEFPYGSEADIMAKVNERMARRTGNKSPPPVPAASKIAEAPRDASQRQSGQVYNTPKGPLKWVGNGWVKP